MKIAVIGAGNVGGNLGTLWAQQGYEVCFGVRNPEDERYTPLLNWPKAKIGTVADCAAEADVWLLAVHYRDLEHIYPELKAHTQGKILIDATNPVMPGLSGLMVGQDTSAAEEIQRRLPDVAVVKAFNNLGANNFKNLDFQGYKADTFLCGDDPEAKATVKTLAEAIGFRAVDAGHLSQARYVEPMAMLWITMAYKYDYGPNFTFKMLER